MDTIYTDGRGSWGVKKDGQVIYKPLFSQEAAIRIVMLSRRVNPPENWEDIKRILVSEGLLHECG